MATWPWPGRELIAFRMRESSRQHVDLGLSYTKRLAEVSLLIFFIFLNLVSLLMGKEVMHGVEVGVGCANCLGIKQVDDSQLVMGQLIRQAYTSVRVSSLIGRRMHESLKHPCLPRVRQSQSRTYLLCSKPVPPLA